MSSVETITTTTALVLVLSSYALAQGSLDAGGTGGAVDSSRGAVNSVPSAVDRVPSAVESVPSAVESARSAVEASTPRRGPSSRSAWRWKSGSTTLER
jgi:hypothetical protein